MCRSGRIWKTLLGIRYFSRSDLQKEEVGGLQAAGRIICKGEVVRG